MSSTELRMQRARVKSLAQEIDRFPTERLVRKLCGEAEAGFRCDPKCTKAFFAVWEVATDLLIEGAGVTTMQLAAAVHALDDIVAARLMQHHTVKKTTEIDSGADEENAAACCLQHSAGKAGGESAAL